VAKRLGVFICECGANIADKVDIDKVIVAVSPLKDVEVAERHKLLCSEGGKQFLKQSIEEHGLTHVVVAACSPKQHELTFMNVCEQAGLNPQLFQLTNIREQCAWVTPDREEATDKAIRCTRAAISRVRQHSPLRKKELECSPDVLVVGGGIAGIKASQLLGAPDRKVYLVEKTSSLGGKVKSFSKLFTSLESGASLLEQELQSLQENENIEVLTESEVEQILGFLGNFEVVVRKAGDEELNFNVGAVVLATGFEPFEPKRLPQYGYGVLDDVYTGLEFEEMNIPDGPRGGKILLKDGRPPESVAIIHCVGREEKDYCSKVCCLYSLKFDRMLRSQLPAVRISHIYRDLCIPGKSYQRFYEETKELGVEFLRSAKAEVVTGNGKGAIIQYEAENGPRGDLAVDMVILLSAMESGGDTPKLAEMLNIPRDEKGFFVEEHRLLSPVASAVEGVFVVGCAQGPHNIAESIVQAEAAAGKVLSSLVPGRKLELEVRTSEISAAICTGCKTCISVCPYGAITFDETRRIAVVNEVLCHGCGSCAAACPSGAATLRHFTFGQTYQELKEALR